MSSLLEQAIADAKMLKETARKNAEAQILEQYSEEIKQSVEALLEQDETGLGDLGLGTPAATEAATQLSPETKKTVDKIKPAYLSEGDLQEIEIDLNSLVEKVSQLEENVGIAPQTPAVMGNDTAQVEEEPLEEDKSADATAADVRAAEEKAKAEKLRAADKKEKEEEAKKAEPMAEEDQFTIDEELMMDMENVRDPDNTEIELNKQKKIAAALEAQKDELLATVEKKEEEKSELEEALDAAIAKLSETKAKLKKSLDINVQLKEGIEFLTEKITESNLLNARLLYTNKTLGNSSLNERQKNQIAESISHASSVEEAKTIYSALLKSTASVSEKRPAPQSLTEALNKGPSPFLPRKQTQVDPTMDRWKLLAGIKK